MPHIQIISYGVKIDVTKEMTTTIALWSRLLRPQATSRFASQQQSSNRPVIQGFVMQNPVNEAD